MREYAAERITLLLESFRQQLKHASRHRDEDAIHDLRVSIRRLSEALRIFRQFFPEAKVKKVRRRLGVLMDHAAAVRDHDVTLLLLADAGESAGPLAARLREEREAAEREMVRELRRWTQRDYPARWPAKLLLHLPESAPQ